MHRQHIAVVAGVIVLGVACQGRVQTSRPNRGASVNIESLGGSLEGGIAGQLERYADSSITLGLSLRKPVGAPFRTPKVGSDSLTVVLDRQTLTLPIVSVVEFRMPTDTFAGFVRPGGEHVALEVEVDSQTASLLRTTIALTVGYDIYRLKASTDELTQKVRPFLGVRLSWRAAPKGASPGLRFESKDFSFSIAFASPSVLQLGRRPDGELYLDLTVATTQELSASCVPSEMVMVTERGSYTRSAAWEDFVDAGLGVRAQVPVDSVLGVALFTSNRLGFSWGCYSLEAANYAFRDLAKFDELPGRPLAIMSQD
jgi:hypothetical protein